MSNHENRWMDENRFNPPAKFKLPQSITELAIQDCEQLIGTHMLIPEIKIA